MPRPARCAARALGLLAVCGLLAACGGTGTTTDLPTDTDPGADDAGVDVPGDAGGDVAHDAAMDGSGDAAGDAGDLAADGGDVAADEGDVALDVWDAAFDAGDLPADDGDAAVDGTDVPIDLCPTDPEKVDPGLCGCGIPDTPNCAEVDPPVPDPMGWAEAPHATGTTSIAMTAEAASDPSGVQYYFACVAGPCHDSGWVDGSTFEDAGLAPDILVAYRVRARDRSANLNETAWSAEASAAPDRDPGYASGLDARFFDFDLPLPSLPDLSGLAADVSRIDAQIAYLPTTEPWTGLGPGFADTFASRHGGFLRIEAPGDYTLTLASDNGARLWLGAEPILDAAGSGPPVEVSTVRTLAAGYHPIRVDFHEDAGPAALVLSYEGPGIAKQVVPPTALYHADPPDAAPPSPDPAAWEMPPVATGTRSVAMAAATASDPSGVQYAFECVTGPCHDSGWQSARTYEDAGLAAGTQYAYRVRKRDFSLAENPSGPSSASLVATDTVVPGVVGQDLSFAETTLTGAALVLGDVGGEFSDTVPAGVVLRQAPAPGVQVPAGSAVDVVVSSGPEMVLVPDLLGQAQAQAAAAVVAARLTIGTVTRAASCSVVFGGIVGQQPAGGTKVPKGTAVSLVVSRGPEQVVINELLYHPRVDLALEEFLELYNPCASPVILENWRVQGLGTFAFGAGASIEPGGYVVLAQDAAAFEAAYGFAPDFVYAGAKLSNSGELLTVVTSSGVVADQITWDDTPPWPVTPDGLGPSMEIVDPKFDNTLPRNWHASIDPSGSTPRARNSVDAEGLPPWITRVGHGNPEAWLQIPVTAFVEDATTITLTYVVDWGTPVVVPMLDDGESADGDAGDGLFGVLLPAQPPGTLVRYRIDADGPTGSMGFPRDDDTVLYAGTYIAPATASDLDAFHWIIHPDAYARALLHFNTDETEPAMLFHRGVLYDGVQIRVRGQSSRGWPKKHWNFTFAQGHDFSASGLATIPVGGFNLQSSYADKSYVREILSYETFRDAGSPSNVIQPVAVYQNGQFFGLYNYLEDKDASYLERNGLDPDGSFYKAFGSQCTYDPEVPLAGPWEKVNPKDDDYTDLAALLEGVNTLTGQARRDFLFDNVDIPAMLSYHAVSVLIHNNDQVAKNYYLYRDTNGTRRWAMQAWDMDLTFGRSYQGKVLNDDIFADVDSVEKRPFVSPSHPLFGDSEHQKWDYLWNRLTDALLKDPEIRQMYYRRLRSLMDEFLVEGRFEARIDHLSSLVADEAEMDRQTWGWYLDEETPAQAVARLKAEYLGRRRTHLFTTHRVDGEIPEAQSPDPVVVINEILYNPYDDPLDPLDPGNDLEFLELFNPSPTEAVDVSGWQVTAVALTIPSGSVILPGGYLLVVKNDVAFRGRYGPGHFVAGQYEGKLDNGGEHVALVNRAGAVVDEVSYDDNAPWPTATDGGGPSLELLDPATDNSLPASWAASLVSGGTPGTVNSVR